MAFRIIDDITFPAFLSATVKRFPEKIAIEDSSISYTYSELDRKTRDLAAGFASIGIKRGDHVCVWRSFGSIPSLPTMPLCVSAQQRS